MEKEIENLEKEKKDTIEKLETEIEHAKLQNSDEKILYILEMFETQRKKLRDAKEFIRIKLKKNCRVLLKQKIFDSNFFKIFLYKHKNI